MNKVLINNLKNLKREYENYINANKKNVDDLLREKGYDKISGYWTNDDIEDEIQYVYDTNYFKTANSNNTNSVDILDGFDIEIDGLDFLGLTSDDGE